MTDSALGRVLDLLRQELGHSRRVWVATGDEFNSGRINGLELAIQELEHVSGAEKSARTWHALANVEVIHA